MRKTLRALLLFLVMAVSVGMLAGCSDPLSMLTGANNANSNSGEVIELADNTDIPEDGVIKAAQFRSIAGKDRTVTFTGKSNGVEYIWSYNGKNIKNPADQNLKIDVVTASDDLNKVKTLANSAPEGVGVTIKQTSGFITVPRLTLKMGKKWDVNAGIFLKYLKKENQVTKISAITFDKQVQDQTVMTFNVTQGGDTYYAVCGKSGSSEPTAQDGTGTTGSGGSSSSSSSGSDSTGGGGDGSNTVTISISCATVLNNMDKLNNSKKEFVPADGWILKPTQVTFTEGQNIHDVLQKVCQENGIQMDSDFTPAYNSAYVRGINQIYEFDCGDLSGWMFKVNGWFPNYGASQYNVKGGDVIDWVYTCDLGKDVGDNSQY